MTLWIAALPSVLLVTTVSSSAQVDMASLPHDPLLVHLDTPSVAEPGHLSGRLSVRAFGGDEDTVYTGIGVHYGLGNGWEAVARGVFAGRKGLRLAGSGGAIRHGGTDVEILAKYGPASTSHLAGLIGVAFADTPAQRDAILTLGGTAATSLGARFTGYLNPRAVFLDQNTLVGIGLGLRARLSDSLALVGDWTPIVSGDNTRDTATGARKRRDVFGIALRFATSARLSALEVDLGYANGTGSTTGFGLTPGLGNSGCFYFALAAHH